MVFKIREVGRSFTGYQEFFIEFLSFEGVIEEKYRNVLMKELRDLMKLVIANPLTKEEWKRLKELFEKNEKDKLALEEVDEFLKLVRKVVREYWDRREVCRLHIYAAIVRCLTYRKYYEKNEAEHEENIKDRFSLNFVQGDI
jgi:hypothetical protein